AASPVERVRAGKGLCGSLAASGPSVRGLGEQLFELPDRRAADPAHHDSFRLRIDYVKRRPVLDGILGREGRVLRLFGVDREPDEPGRVLGERLVGEYEG